jgi:N-acetylmuramoyl-L-alanine amidase
MMFVTIAAIVAFLASCAPIHPIPPQSGGEPKEITVSQLAAELGWTWERDFETDKYIVRSPKGDQISFEIGSDLVGVDSTKWRMERDAYYTAGNDLVVPESAFNFIVRHFGKHHLAKDRRTTPSDYELKPIDSVEEPKPTPAKGDSLKGLTVCVDAGHGGKDPGGIGHGVYEKNVALPVALMLEEMLLAEGATVVMTRNADTYPTLDDRVNIANGKKCDLFISIHANIAPGSDAVTGFEVLYNPKSKNGARLAESIVSKMDTATDSPNRGAKKDWRELRVLQKTKMPAVLVELGFLSNEGEAQRLTEKAYQDELAKAVFEGVSNHWASKKAKVSR